MIDEIADSYQQFCELVDIPNIYEDKEDFNRRYPFDEENPDSIISNLTRVYDNAIVLRESIGSESLSYVQLAIYEMNRAKASDAPLIEMQKVIDNILAFWGIVDDQIEDARIRNIIKAGRKIERIDMYARLEVEGQELRREVKRLIPRLEKCGLDYNDDSVVSLRESVHSAEIDYYEVVRLVESIIA